ncbi:MAG: F0F1 ATP synthase subunit A [Pirellulales bacterium]|nr:F0F1 ATP synthase subunit A [Pirellulales bacterium]
MSNPAEHVQDSLTFEFPFKYEWHIPQPFEPWGFHLTKFMVLEVVAAVLTLVIFLWLARRIASGKPPRGRSWNLFEMMLLFIRDQVVRPTIGPPHEADRFLPFLWTQFFFVLFCNLLGLIPWMGSPTGAFEVTTVLAIGSFLAVIMAGMAEHGIFKYWAGLVPHMELPLIMKMFLVPMLWVIELSGLLIKSTILSIRLLANMFAGHLVLAVVLGFIAQTAALWLWYGVAPASVLGATALNVLELLVAFLQAYIFVFITSLLIGMAIHQH